VEYEKSRVLQLFRSIQFQEKEDHMMMFIDGDGGAA